MNRKFSQTTFIFLGIVITSVMLALFFILHVGAEKFDKNNTVQLHFVDNISSAHSIIIEQFNKINRGSIEVIPINLPFTKFSTNERKELLARSLRSKSNLIDIFSVDVIWVPRFAKWGERLDFFFTAQELDLLLAKALQSCFHNKQLVAIPLYTDVGVMYYRDDLISNHPENETIKENLKKGITWSEFLEIKDQMQISNNNYYLFPAKNYEGLVCSFLEQVRNSSLPAGDKASYNFNTNDAVKALEHLVNLVNKFDATPLEVIGFDEQQCYLYALERDVLFFRGWPGFPLQHEELIERFNKTGLFKIAPIPYFEGSELASTIGGWNLMISKHSPYKREAVKFIKFVLKKENQEILFLNGGYIPVNIQIYQDSLNLEKYSNLLYYKKLFDKGIHRPYIEEYTKISDVLSYYIRQAIKNEISPSEALAKATDLINNKKFIIR